MENPYVSYVATFNGYVTKVREKQCYVMLQYDYVGTEHSYVGVWVLCYIMLPLHYVGFVSYVMMSYHYVANKPYLM